MRGGRAAAAASSGSSTGPSGFPTGARGRPEIEELTRQTRVPVLVDGDEVIHDSKRILQYLDWKYRRAKTARGARVDDLAAYTM